MRLDDLDPSDNARDIGTGSGGFGGNFSGGGGLGSLLIGILPLLMGRRMGCGTIALLGVGALFLYSTGMLGGGGTSGVQSGQGSTSEATSGGAACDTKEELFACQVLTSTEQTWGQYFSAAGQQYPAPKLFFYSQQNQSGCGAAQSAMGPFYCPTDNGIYLDTTFFAQMKRQMGVDGDFAQAYVIAHEVGHHVQTITGISEKIRTAQSRVSQAEGNRLQVAMELQADCFAGFWAAKNSSRMEPGDIEEGMRAANAIGDDTLMRQAGQRPVESMFTHGTSEERMAWLRRGLQANDPKACDTISGVL
jgi:uncharacterized protein